MKTVESNIVAELHAYIQLI